MPNRGGGNGADLGAYELQEGPQTGPNFVVNSLADTDDGVCGPSNCTLREAINAANTNADQSNITFDETVFASPRKTVGVNRQLPGLTTRISITAPAAGVVVRTTTNDLNGLFTIHYESKAVIVLSDLTIQSNSSGCYAFSGDLTLRGCTLQSSGSISSGVGLANSGTIVTLENCTIAEMTHSGVLVYDGAFASLKNCTISGNFNGIHISGGLVSLNNSIVSGNTDSNIRGVIRDGNFNITTDNAGLDPNGLQENGGKTQTIALLATSPAIDAGNTTLTLDQRGMARPQGTRDDIGAYEYETVSIQIADATLIEGDSGTAILSFDVTLSKAVSQPVQINYATANGSAKSGRDYNRLTNSDADSDGGTPGALTIPAGQLSGTIRVSVVGDLLDEANETFYLFLSSPVSDSVRATITRGRGIGTITDDDAPPSISVDNITLVEGNSGSRYAAFTLRLSSPSGQPVRVTVTGANGTATAGNDYTALPPTVVSFTTGASAAIVRVLIQSDVLDEPNETFLLNLSSPINATIADHQGVASIIDDDATPSLAINDVSVTEGNSGTKTLNFTVTRTGQSAGTITVNYATANGIARAGSDYVAKSGTLNFASGSSATQTISVTINGDTQLEANETLYVLLTGPVNAAVSRARGVGTIVNDDSSG